MASHRAYPQRPRQSKPGQCLEFDYEALRKATNNFDKRKVNDGGCLLGEGGFGPVFRGILKQTEVAIKELRKIRMGDKGAQDLAREQFEAELQVLSLYRHPNLVTLMGFSATPNCPCCLIYEFVPNGTLEDALETGFGVKDKSIDKNRYGIGLPWMARISIALDTARGLSYLHTAVEDKPLVHRDVKSANVLLDLSFRAKVGDFGLARALDQHDSSLQYKQQTHRVVGTSGYIAPEYYHGTITTKLDTYAFGVILLELLTGLPSYDQQRKYTDLFTYIDMKKEESKFAMAALVDTKAGNWPSDSFKDLFKIADQCLEQKLYVRKEMEEVYVMLESLERISSKLYAEEEEMRERKEKKGTAVLSNY